MVPPGGGPARQLGTGRFVPLPPPAIAPLIAPRPGGWRRVFSPAQQRPRWMNISLVVLACYLSSLAAVNLTSPQWRNNRLAVLATHIFPRIGQSAQQLNYDSVDAEWQAIQDNYVYRGVNGVQGNAGAEQGIVDALHLLHPTDKFTLYLPTAQYNTLQQDLNGQRSGSIGISLDPRCSGGIICPTGQTPTELVITDVLSGQPADTAGIKDGDVLVEVNGKAVGAPSNDSTISQISGTVRGSPGTTVNLTVRRGAQQLTLTPTRADLNIPSAFVKHFGSVLYLQITAFDTDTGSLVKQLLSDNLTGSNGVVLDLRGNPGGYVTAAQEVASQFVAPSSNHQDVVVRRGRLNSQGDPQSGQTVKRDSLQDGGVATAAKVVILIDGNSASAAEIVAACLHDYGRATVVGVTSYGKGSVQQDFPLPDGNDLHLTIEKWYSPNGSSIDGNGIIPDQLVALPNPSSRYRADAQSAAPGVDPQLQAALRVLGG